MSNRSPLQALRWHIGATQVEFGRVAQVTGGQISNAENGSCNLSVQRLKRIADRYAEEMAEIGLTFEDLALAKMPSRRVRQSRRSAACGG